MVCVCGTVFCCDDADLTALNGQRQLYCSKSCKKRSEKARRAHRRHVCTRRGKVPYPDAAAAQHAAARQLTQQGWILRPYLCPCGSWHLTKKPYPDEWFPDVDSPAFRNWMVRNG